MSVCLCDYGLMDTLLVAAWRHVDCPACKSLTCQCIGLFNELRGVAAGAGCCGNVVMLLLLLLGIAISRDKAMQKGQTSSLLYVVWTGACDGICCVYLTMLSQPTSFDAGIVCTFLQTM